MIDFHFWPTPNGWKIAIMLEECGLLYTTHTVNIGRGEQFTPEFSRISPNQRIPAIVDHDSDDGQPLALFESGAILQYLADKTGRFLPTQTRPRYEVLQWLAWQVGGLGPMAGQLSHFINYAPEPMPYAIERYRKEYERLLTVVEKRLTDREYLAGEYSIADIATWPWLLPYKRFGVTLDSLPNVRRWHAAIKTRPAVERGVNLGKENRPSGPLDDESRKHLFGATPSTGATPTNNMTGRTQ